MKSKNALAVTGAWVSGFASAALVISLISNTPAGDVDIALFSIAAVFWGMVSIWVVEL